MHVYVEGDLERVMHTSDYLAGIDLPEADFVGITIDDVPERPRDQDGG